MLHLPQKDKTPLIDFSGLSTVDQIKAYKSVRIRAVRNPGKAIMATLKLNKEVKDLVENDIKFSRFYLGTCGDLYVLVK